MAAGRPGRPGGDHGGGQRPLRRARGPGAHGARGAAAGAPGSTAVARQPHTPPADHRGGLPAAGCGGLGEAGLVRPQFAADDAETRLERRRIDAHALDRTGLKVDDVQHYICHQSNLRIIESAVEKLKLPPERVYVNIDRYGNTSAASIPICLDELSEAGRIEPGKPIILVAFGAGVTWASCVWNT
ncbi:MAG: hypothetical protein EB126_11120 [Synechococcaceae bacterium WBB_10_009]|nr:hypothetical protein [Synechococcaceae bacterium WBB_10_009]